MEECVFELRHPNSVCISTFNCSCWSRNSNIYFKIIARKKEALENRGKSTRELQKRKMFVKHIIQIPERLLETRQKH